MPKYEIGYILSSGVADDEVTNVTSEISRGVEASGGKILNEDHWGRKKLAYPIGRTRNGYYVFLTVDLDSAKVAEVEHKLLTRDGVIRFLIVNLTDADRRKTHDAEIRARRPQMETVEAVRPNEDINQVDIEQEIEKAIKSEETRV